MTDNVNVPDLVITEAEIHEYVKPYAVDYGGRSIKLRAVKSLSIDDMLGVGKTAEVNVLEALNLVAVDEFTQTTLRTMPHPLLFRVFDAWEASGEVDQGESGGSEESSETTEPQ